VSSTDHWRIVWNLIRQQVQQSSNLMEHSPYLEDLGRQFVKKFLAF